MAVVNFTEPEPVVVVLVNVPSPNWASVVWNQSGSPLALL
jgi:hypothetical protein